MADLHRVLAVPGLASAADLSIGFLALEARTPATTEAHVLAVRFDRHRRGVGRAMFDVAAAAQLRSGTKA